MSLVTAIFYVTVVILATGVTSIFVRFIHLPFWLSIALAFPLAFGCAIFLVWFWARGPKRR